jgi:hypothetical protein
LPACALSGEETEGKSMNGVSIGVRSRVIVLAAAVFASMMFMGSGVQAARQGCQAAGPDSASCSFVVTSSSTFQVIAVGGEYWEVDVTKGKFTSTCAFGRTGAAIGQCFASAGSTIEAFVRQGAILVQLLPSTPSLP